MPTAIRSPLAALLILLPCVLMAQPFPTFFLDSARTMGPSVDASNYPAVALDESGGLVAWTEAERVWAARLGPGYVLLDTVSLDITGEAGPRANDRTWPSVAAADGNYIVAWDNGYDSAACCVVRRDGSIASSYTWPLEIRVGAHVVSAASDGGKFVVVILYDTQLRFARVSPGGALIDTIPRPFVSGDWPWHPEVAYGDGRFLVVWDNDGEGIYGAFLFPDSSNPGSGRFPIRPDVVARHAEVAHDGRNFVVAWVENELTTKASRVSSSGCVLDSTGILIAPGIDGCRRPGIASRGDTTMVSVLRWDTLRLQVLGALMDSDGRVVQSNILIDRAPLPPSDYWNRNLSLAAHRTGWLPVWTRSFPSDTSAEVQSIAYRRLDASGQAMDSSPRTASFGANKQYDPGIAAIGGDFLAVWRDTRTDSGRWRQRICGVRLDAEGRPLDPGPLCIGGEHATLPAVAGGDSCYLVTWEEFEGQGIWAARVSPEGVLLDSTPIAVHPIYGHSRAHVTFGGGVFLVVWLLRSQSACYGARIDQAGVLLDTVPFPVGIGSADRPYYIAACYGDSVFLVVRIDARERYQAVRLNAEGQVLDTAEIRIAEFSRQSAYPLKLAYGAGVFLLMDCLYPKAWRITTAGEVLDTAIHLPGDDRYRSVAFDGQYFVVAGEGRNAGSETGTMRAMRMTPEGEFVDPVPVQIATCGMNSRHHNIAADSSGLKHVVFMTLDDHPYFTFRVRGLVFPGIAIAERPPTHDKSAPLPTHIRAGPIRIPGQDVEVFDPTGRRVENDRFLRPGVYLVRSARNPGYSPHTGTVPGFADPIRAKVVVTD